MRIPKHWLLERRELRVVEKVSSLPETTFVSVGLRLVAGNIISSRFLVYQEHDVTLVWSITSGKRLVLADGQEIHFSSSRSAIFDYSWTMRGNHVLKIVAHASPPLSQTPGFRQYDFFVDGQSFFSFPKLYRLGLSANDSRATSPSSPTQLAERGQRYSSYSSTRLSGSNIVSFEAPNNPDEVRALRAKRTRAEVFMTNPCFTSCLLR